MSFKTQKHSAWDEGHIQQLFNKAWEDHNIFCLSTFDSFVERIMLHHAESLKPYKLMNASEIKSDWMNDNALNMDLFASLGESENYIILNSEQLTADVQEVFLNYSNNLTKKFLLLFKNGNKTSAKFINQLLKSECSQALTIEAPKFWDYPKYFTYYLKSINCPYEKNLERVSFEGKDMGPSEIAQFAVSLSQGADGQKLSLDIVQKALDDKAEDVFTLVKKLANKNFHSFYESLLKISHDADQFRSAVVFLQSHFMKVKYPMTYIKGNRKPSKYDLEIERVSRRWSKPEIDNVLNLLSDFELISKRDAGSIEKEVRNRIVLNKKGELSPPFNM